MSFESTLQEALDIGFLPQLLETEKTLAAVCLALGYSSHGRNTGALNIFLKAKGLEFKNYSIKTQEFGVKECVHCGKAFKFSIHDKTASKVLTCSKACSGAYPLFIRNRVDAKIGAEPTHYITIANRAGLTTCCVCEEKEVVDIHHLDEDSTNNSLDNLIPLCPTHHAYMHRGKSVLIIDKILKHLDERS